MESLKYLSGDDSFFKEFLAVFLLFGIVPDCWKDIVSENKYLISCPLQQFANLIIVRIALISFIGSGMTISQRLGMSLKYHAVIVLMYGREPT